MGLLIEINWEVSLVWILAVFTDGDVIFLTSQQLEKTAEIQVPDSSHVLKYSRLPITQTFKRNQNKGSSFREFEFSVVQR